MLYQEAGEWTLSGLFPFPPSTFIEGVAGAAATTAADTPMGTIRPQVPDGGGDSLRRPY